MPISIKRLTGSARDAGGGRGWIRNQLNQHKNVFECRQWIRVVVHAGSCCAGVFHTTRTPLSLIIVIVLFAGIVGAGNNSCRSNSMFGNVCVNSDRIVRQCEDPEPASPRYLPLSQRHSEHCSQLSCYGTADYNAWNIVHCMITVRLLRSFSEKIYRHLLQLFNGIDFTCLMAWVP